jgi:hypothetical protein
MRMQTLKRFLAFIPVLAACAGTEPTPLVAPQQPRERRNVQREFRLGTFDFGKVGPDPHELGAVIPAMLLTELHEAGRFSIYEGGAIRMGGRAVYYGGAQPRSDGSKGPPLDEGNAVNYVDGYLSGTITTLGEEQACLDVRLSNAVTHEVLYSRDLCIDMAAGGRVDRAALGLLAEDIGRAIKKVGNGKVISAEGEFVYCDKGAKSGVRRGMVAYLVGTGDTVPDGKMHREVQRYTRVDPAQLSTMEGLIIVGQMYILSAEEDYSVGVLYQGTYALPGDTVHFK